MSRRDAHIIIPTISFAPLRSAFDATTDDFHFQPSGKPGKQKKIDLTDLAWPATVPNLRDPLGPRLTVILSISDDDDHSDTKHLETIFLFDQWAARQEEEHRPRQPHRPLLACDRSKPP